MGFIILLILGLAVYFLPTICGWNKRNAGAIFVLNLFLGWTLVGWVVALVWGVSSDNEPQHVIVQQPLDSKTIIDDRADKYDKLTRLKTLLDNGVITEEEYKLEKQKILS